MDFGKRVSVCVRLVKQNQGRVLVQPAGRQALQRLRGQPLRPGWPREQLLDQRQQPILLLIAKVPHTHAFNM